MLTPSIFGENLFDEFFDDFFDFPVFDDPAMKKAKKKLYGRHAANMMKTDVKEQPSGGVLRPQNRPKAPPFPAVRYASGSFSPILPG